MAEKTAIAWTDHTFNIAWGCVKVSPGCANCYADTLAKRRGSDVWGPGKPRRTFKADHWKQLAKWQRDAVRDGVRRRVFCCSMCDVFEDHPTIDAERERLWDAIRESPSLDFQLLTKRADRIEPNLPADWGDGYPNVWLGVSVEDQKWAEKRLPILEPIPAVVRFASYEPALGPIDWYAEAGGTRLIDCVDWIIYGGESGPGWRQHDLAWPRATRVACDESGVAFFFKQSAAPRTEMGIELDGQLVRAYPEPRGVKIPQSFGASRQGENGLF